MKNIVDEIRKVDNLYHANGCTLEQVHDAERELGLTFPKEFIDYVMEFGAISFYGTEWTGLNVGGYVNVVEATEQERNFNAEFPKDCFVIENQGIDGIINVVNEKGQVFTVQNNDKKILVESLEDYLEICKSRKD
ncbi:MAG: SMI1/KNR4 family protein [Clostridium sp.]|nr:SMI1/KNR4 family protein [Clostridium sp.]